MRHDAIVVWVAFKMAMTVQLRDGVARGIFVTETCGVNNDFETREA